LTSLLILITCLNWYLFGGFIYPFNRQLDPVLVAQFDVTGKYVLDKPGGRFWRAAYKYEIFGLDIEPMWFNPNDPQHFGADMPELDYKKHCYVITYGQKIDTLSYNCWDIISGTWEKAGQMTFQEEFYPSTVFIYELPKIMIENDINHTVVQNASVSWELAPYVDTDTFISGEMLQDKFGKAYLQRHKYVLSEKTEDKPAKVHTQGYIYDFYVEQNGVYDVTNINVSVCIEPLPSDLVVSSKNIPTATGVDPKDLRTADSPGSHQVDDIWYIYETDEQSNGTEASLKYIRWSTGENALEIQFQTGRDYNLDDGSFLAQLLREETAKTAIDSFNNEIQ
jgi:hypothetical protein